MKTIILGLFSFAALSANAQTTTPVSTSSNNHNLPTVILTAEKLEWQNSLASQIPFEKHVPYYNNYVKYTEDIDQAQLDANAAHYFENEFGSRSVMLQTSKHNYTGQGMYLFAADKKIGAPGIYKVYYTVNIHIKGKKAKVTMSDFRLENQHSQVSFAYLLKNAMENDTKSLNILSIFQRNNQSELTKVMASLSAKDHSDYATASIQ